MKALIRNASSKEGSRNIETEVITTERWLQKQRFLKKEERKKGMRVITDNTMKLHFCLRLLTVPQTTITVIIIQVLTRPGNCGTCSFGQVIRATLLKTHP